MADETVSIPAPEPAPEADPADAPRRVWLAGGGHHPGLPQGLFLGSGTFEALAYPDGRLELVGVTLPGASLASEPANIAESQSAGASERESALSVAEPEPEPESVSAVESPAEPAAVSEPEPEPEPQPAPESEPEQPTEVEAEADPAPQAE